MRRRTSPASTPTASQARDDDIEDSDDAADDGVEDGADGVDDGHQAGSDCLEDGFDLGVVRTVMKECEGV